MLIKINGSWIQSRAESIRVPASIAAALGKSLTHPLRQSTLREDNSCKNSSPLQIIQIARSLLRTSQKVLQLMGSKMQAAKKLLLLYISRPQFGGLKITQ